NNPFGNYISPANTPSDDESVTGPFPGDVALLEFNLYSNRALTKRAGSGALLCSYDFNQSGFCDAVYRFAGKSLVGVSSMNFADRRFTVGITGGTSAYRNAAGQVRATAFAPSKRQARAYRIIPDGCACRVLEAQHLVFSIAKGAEGKAAKPLTL